MISRGGSRRIRPGAGAPLACAAVLLAIVATAALPESASAQSAPAGTATARDGALLSREPCTASGSTHADYRKRVAEQWQADAAAAGSQGLPIRPLDQFLASALSENDYRERKAYEGFQCERLTYSSDGLRVVAYLWRPARVPPSSGRLPLILFNRGGYGEEFKLRPNTWFGFYNYLKAGYAVLGTQYRGNDGGEGRDELGGADVRDVLNLVPLARELGFPADTRLYALGFSRGGLMTLQAMRQGLPIRAAAVMGAPTDLRRNLDAPRARAVVAARIPGFEQDPEGALRERSPILHVESLKQPLLILHGTADALVPATEALRMAEALVQRRLPVELVLYDGDTHGLALNGADRDRRILEWFAGH